MKFNLVDFLISKGIDSNNAVRYATIINDHISLDKLAHVNKEIKFSGQQYDGTISKEDGLFVKTNVNSPTFDLELYSKDGKCSIMISLIDGVYFLKSVDNNVDYSFYDLQTIETFEKIASNSNEPKKLSEKRLNDNGFNPDKYGIEQVDNIYKVCSEILKNPYYIKDLFEKEQTL